MAILIAFALAVCPAAAFAAEGGGPMVAGSANFGAKAGSSKDFQECYMYSDAVQLVGEPWSGEVYDYDDNTLDPEYYEVASYKRYSVVDEPQGDSIDWDRYTDCWNGKASEWIWCDLESGVETNGFTQEGIYEVTLVGKNGYTGSISQLVWAYEYDPYNLLFAEIEEGSYVNSIGSKWDGQVWLDGNLLKEGKDYIVEYWHEGYEISYDDKFFKRPGVYYICIVGTGDYQSQVMLDGYYSVPGWVSYGETWYYIDQDGYYVDGWQKIDGSWYHFDEESAMEASKWVKDSKGWCYLEASGRMATNKWVKDSRGWCYVGADGYMVSGAWRQVSGTWYYFDAGGHMVTGTQSINGKTYTFASNGAWIG